MFVCIVSEFGHFIRYPSAITWNILWSPGESLQLASAGALFSLRKKNPLAKSWVTVQCLPTCPPPALGHWSRWAVCLLTALKDAKHKTGWILSLVHLGLFIALLWNWNEDFLKKSGSEKVFALLIFHALCLRNWFTAWKLYQTPVWRHAPASLEAEQFHTPASVQCQTGWGPEQPDLVQGLSAHGRAVQTKWFLRCLPTQTFLWFCKSEAGVWTGQKYGKRRSWGMQGWQRPSVALPFRMGGQGAPRALCWYHRNPGLGHSFGEEVWCQQSCWTAHVTLCHQAEKEEGVWTCRRGNRSREDCVTSAVTAANSANCHRLSGNFIRPACQFKFSHKNVYFS